MRPAKAIVAVTLAAAALLACGETPVEQNIGPVDQEDAAQLTLSTDSIVVDMGDGWLLTSSIRNASGPVQYASRDQSVATVDANGAIRAVGVGSAYVVGTLSDRPGARDSAHVRVHPLAISGDPCPASRPRFGVATAADRARCSHTTPMRP